VLLGVVTPPEHETWLGVGEVMQAEAEDKAQRLLDEAAASVRALAGLEPEKIVRTGDKADEVVKLIEADEDISLLVLAAGAGRDGPGPLVSGVAGKSAASFPIPVAIVPGHLEDEEIDALA
jgi:nucleotide-binding universal stress UspA family protein